MEPKSSEAHLRIARAEQANGNLDAALEQYEAAIRIDPFFFDAYVLSRNSSVPAAIKTPQENFCAATCSMFPRASPPARPDEPEARNRKR